MAELSMSGAIERDIDQAITALKKGAHLLKYGRRGKPKFCPFWLSQDESVLLWYSGKVEKQLILSHVSRIIPGQRTAIFQRYPRPEKEYQSFSLIYNDRSLDLICKDKDEAEVWFVGLKSLVSHGKNQIWRIDSKSDRNSSDAYSSNTCTRKNFPLSSPYNRSDIFQKDVGDTQQIQIPEENLACNGLGKALSEEILYRSTQKGLVKPGSVGNSVNNPLNGPLRVSAVDNFRVSLSSAVSTSSQGSCLEDFGVYGDIFIWGECMGYRSMGSESHRTGCLPGVKMDALLPKVLESGVVLDVQNIACGDRHAALVTKQGEVFSWGEESGGRLGHGIEADVTHPKLIGALGGMHVELVACGEYHTCAVTLSGDLYTWGDGTHNLGLLGHGSDACHWIPKMVGGPMEGLHVSSVSCGPWHTAVVTSAGHLFTFGDGTFGALGHGDCRSTCVPREVESLRGFRTMRASCGIWHTAAVVEIMVESSSSSSNSFSGKLFTWGDGDKGQLGHDDYESRLVPMCVSALSESSFIQVACGHSITIALTTSGRVFAMGNPIYGQLGNPEADGKVPICVEGKLHENFVEEISCGSHHIAVLTSKTEVYTWGKGANGQLGHGDIEDRSTPTLVEALKDKQVKSIACGSTFTAAIYLHKGVSTADQSMCSGCRLPFGFRRKRHNCYNCALGFCKGCSVKKSLRAAFAPNMNKPYRVCDDCFVKLKKFTETFSTSRFAKNRSGSISQSSYEMTEKDILDSKLLGQLSRVSSVESLRQAENQSFSRPIRKSESNSSRVSPVPNGSALYSSRPSNSLPGRSKKIFSASVPGSRTASRTTSPVSRKASPPHSTTPVPTLDSPKGVMDDSKEANNTLSQEVIMLREQVEALIHKSQLLETELEKKSKQLKEATAVAAEETAKGKATKEVIKSLTAQLKDLADRRSKGAAVSNKSDSIHSPTLDITCPASGGNHSSSVTAFHEPNADDRPSNPLLSNGSKRVTEGMEWVEQCEPGVYITLSLLGGEKDLKRVRFSRRRFTEKDAELWWAENKAKVYDKYSIRTLEKSGIEAPSAIVGKDGLVD